MRRTLVAVVCLVSIAALAAAQDIDIGNILKPAFKDIALLPTRLTAYNQHDDAATASYTCCKARQEKEVKAAIAANEAFLNRFSDTAFADFTLIHYGYVSKFLPDSFRNQEWAFRTLLESYPDSHLADDAAYHLGCLYVRDGDHERAIKVFEYAVKKWPDSPWADHDLHHLVAEYAWTEQPRAALDALNQLAYNYPRSEFCPGSLNALAQKYVELEDYQSAINASRDLIRDFPYNDIADDAQLRIANCYRLMGDMRASLEAFNELVRKWYGSDLTNSAMREANALMDRLQKRGEKFASEPYDTLAWNPAKEAKEMWDASSHLSNNGMHSAAVDKYREFIDKFPGNDLWDNAYYEIGQCYLRQDMMFHNINTASGPDDVARYREDYEASTGDGGPVPTDGNLSSQDAAREAFAYIANNLKGSDLQCDALGQVARCFIKYGEIDAATVPPDAAFTFQEMVIHFPSSSVRCPWYADSTWPVYSFCRLMRFYKDEANWDVAKKMYPTLSAAFTGVFPAGLETDKTAFYELLKLYAAKTDHAYAEMGHHIPYGVNPNDLLPEAHYFQAGMLMDSGNFSRAIELLKPLAEMKGHSLVAPALWLYGQASAKMGRWEDARQAFDMIVTQHKNSGLADDAQIAWTQYQELQKNPAAYDLSTPVQQVRQQFNLNPGNYDVFVGQRCVVFAPFTRSALMRQYNMPNIWDESQKVLRDWAGLPDTERITIVVDRECASTQGNPFKVAGCQISDPPQWNLGLTQIASNVLSQGIPQLKDQHGLMDGIGAFVAASLQYDLVTETRDTIGSAAAVKLPQEEVIRARDAALKALEQYVIAGEDAQLSREVIAGMMYTLLDSGGFSEDRLIDREPYRIFFAKLKELKSETKQDQAFAIAATTAFGDRCTQNLKDWRMQLPATAEKQNKDTQVGMLP